MRCIFQTLHNHEGISARVYGRNECGEYVVRHYANNSLLLKDADYFTENRLDACYTAIANIFGIQALQQIRGKRVHG